MIAKVSVHGDEETRIPFGSQSENAFRDAAHEEYILAELEKARVSAENPHTRWLTHEEVMARMAQRRKARNRV